MLLNVKRFRIGDSLFFINVNCITSCDSYHQPVYWQFFVFNSVDFHKVIMNHSGWRIMIIIYI